MPQIDEIILNGVTYDIGGGGSGLTDDAKQAFLQIATKVAYIDDDGQDYYDTLEDALYPSGARTLSSISAVYTQGGEVYTDDSLDSLKSDLLVTAIYSDSSTETLSSTDYTLSGTLTVGTSVITVTYEDKTTTFAVTVTQSIWVDMRGSVTDWHIATSAGGLINNVSDNGFTITNVSSQPTWNMNIFQSPLSITTASLENKKARIAFDAEVSGYSSGNGLVYGLASVDTTTPTGGGNRTKYVQAEGVSTTGSYSFEIDITSPNVDIANNRYLGMFVYLYANAGTSVTVSNLRVEHS